MKCYLSFLFIVLFFTATLGQTRNKKLLIYMAKKPTSFSGHIEGPVNENDSIRIGLWKDYTLLTTGLQWFSSSIGSNGQFKINLPKIDHPGKIALRIEGSVNCNLRDYIIEPSDSIYCNIKLDSDQYTIGFSGKGSPVWGSTPIK